MSAALVLLHTSAIIFIGAFLFAAVEWIEPNRWVAVILQCAILAAGGAAIAAQLLPGGLLGMMSMGPSIF
jgi:hypothetical protein